MSGGLIKKGTQIPQPSEERRRLRRGLIDRMFEREEDLERDHASNGFGEFTASEFTASRKLRWSTQTDKGREKGYAQWNPQRKTRIILAQVQQIIRAYEAELPLTGRQIFYRLVAAYGYPKDEDAYDRLTYYLTRARRARRIEFNHIRDDGASVMEEEHYRDEEHFYERIREMASNLEWDKLADQEKDIRVYCESAGMMPQLQRVTSRYSIPVYSCSGFDSLTAKYALAEDVAAAYTYRGRPTVILHLGDHDPSGETIFDAISEDVYAFLEVDTPQKPAQEVAIFERLALTLEQVREYERETGTELPWAPPKDSSHAKDWEGERTYQLEALPPDILARILTERIERHMDLERLEAVREDELGARRRIAKALPAPKAEED